MGFLGKIKDTAKKPIDKTKERRENKKQEEEEIAKIRLISITKK